MPLRRVSWSRAAVQVLGLRPMRGLRAPARIGAMTRSRRVSKALMVRAAGGGWRDVVATGLAGFVHELLPRSLRRS